MRFLLSHSPYSALWSQIANLWPKIENVKVRKCGNQALYLYLLPLAGIEWPLKHYMIDDRMR